MNGLAVITDIAQAGIAFGNTLNYLIATRATEFHAFIPVRCAYLGATVTGAASRIVAGTWAARGFGASCRTGFGIEREQCWTSYFAA
ncbi:hypothetical protein D3C79_848790 [compost metagenome]